MKNAPKGILFDLDGTLVDSAPAAIEATQQAFKEFEMPPPDRDAILALMGIPIEESFPILGGPNYATSQHLQVLEKFREIYLPICIQKTILFSGIGRMLKILHEQGSILAVVTSKKSTATYAILEALKIRQLFSVIVCSDHVTHYKPHPAPALTAIGLAKLTPRDCIMVGDSTFDIQMGKDAGCSTCAVSWGSHSVEALKQSHPTYLINAPSELPQIFTP